MLSVSTQVIPFEPCPKAMEWQGHCFHGVFHGAPITKTARCCWCGKEEEHPWYYQPEKQHGHYHPHRPALTKTGEP